MVRAPTPEEEDRRRLSRERRVLLKERVQHSNGPVAIYVGIDWRVFGRRPGLSDHAARSMI